MEKWMGTNALHYPKPKISQNTIKRCCQGSNYSETRFSKWSFSKSLSELDSTYCLHSRSALIQFMIKKQEFNETVLFTYTNVISRNLTEMKLFSFQWLHVKAYDSVTLCNHVTM